MTRIDQLLVHKGLAPSRSAAQRLIAHGAVRWRQHSHASWLSPRKSGEDLPEDCELDVVDDAELRWASRGGLKLAGALEALGLDVHGLTCLDLGQSTGGFTDVLLHQGAALVVGVDVGHGQLHPRLQGSSRVVCIEGCNARDLQADMLAHRLDHRMPERGFDFIVGDLSFISQTLVWPALVPLMGAACRLLMLVKPQFELNPGDLSRGGLVKDLQALGRVEHKLRDAASGLGWTVLNWMESPVTGSDGNREFFIHLQAAPSAPSAPSALSATKRTST